MDELDRKIEEALNAEDRAMLARFAEQGVLRQWFGVYDGAVRWVAAFATVLTFALVCAALYCGWRLFGAVEPIDAAWWATCTVVLMVMVGFLKIWFWMRMESNRILREIKRLELQTARASRP